MPKEHQDLKAGALLFVVFGWKNNSSAFCSSVSMGSSRHFTVKSWRLPAAATNSFLSVCPYDDPKRCSWPPVFLELFASRLSEETCSLMVLPETLTMSVTTELRPEQFSLIARSTCSSVERRLSCLRLLAAALAAAVDEAARFAMEREADACALA